MYKLYSDGAIERISDGAWIPQDPLNCVYINYTKWLTAGNAPENVIVEEPAQEGPTLEEKVNIIWDFITSENPLLIP